MHNENCTQHNLEQKILLIAKLERYLIRNTFNLFIKQFSQLEDFFNSGLKYVSDFKIKTLLLFPVYLSEESSSIAYGTLQVLIPRRSFHRNPIEIYVLVFHSGENPFKECIEYTKYELYVKLRESK